MAMARLLDHAYELAGRRIDPVSGTLLWQGTTRHLRRKELEVLAILAQADGECVLRQTFIDRLWRGNVIVGEQALTDTIAALRRSLPDKDSEHPIIRTIPRQGYQLNTLVTMLQQTSAVFAVGVEVHGRPGWRLRQLLSQTDIQESWLAENDVGQRRMFRFCRSEAHVRRLRREINLLRYLREELLDHQGISTIIDWRLGDPPYFLEMDHPTHGDLWHWSQNQGGLAQLAQATRLQLLVQIAAALAQVHAAAIVHRNISPSAIGIEQRHGEWRAVLGEFGLSQLAEPERRRQWQISTVGLSVEVQSTQASLYRCPERTPGQPMEPTDDIYALGVLGVQLVLGQWSLPVLAEAVAQIQHAGLRAVLRSCLAPRAYGRPEAQQVSAELSRCLASSAREGGSVALRPPASAVEMAPAPSQFLGRYRILDLLGHGGMGTVYLAEQAEPMRRKVALKLIKTGLDSAHVLARFEAERQALAMMSHPNVAAIFDAGSTPAGLPYFAMEYVPGMDIDKHCDHHRLDVRGRIELFLQACDGVLHAHQKGLVHRDLKPGNILVSQRPGQHALVKIIDFGVAKSLQGALVGACVHTHFGHFVGTPAYSSPEQVAARSQEIDTRADVFSLGVVLYRLLIGVTPRSEDELSCCTPTELAQLLRESPTPTLLSRYSRLSEEQRQEIAVQRSMPAEALRALLSTDLDWIVGKCVAIDPEDRYATVQDLKNDLRRWLEHRPIEARPATGLYRFRKLIRRNRANAAMGAAALLLLVGATGAAIYGYYQADRAAIAAAHDRDVSEQVIGLLTQVFASADPYRPGQEQPQDIRQILARGLRLVQKTGQLPADVRSRLLLALADVYGSLGHYEETLSLGQQLLDAQNASGDELNIKVLQLMANANSGLGRPDQAVELAQRALDMAQSSGLGDAALGEARLSVGLALGQNRDHVASASQLHAAYLHLSAAHGELHPRTITALMEHGSALSDSSRFSEAEPLLRRALELNTRLRDPDDMELVYNKVYLGQILLELERDNEAIPLYESAQRSALRKLGSDHPDYLLMLSNLAYAYEHAGRHIDALPLRRQILAATAERKGKVNTAYVSSLINLGSNLLTSGQAQEALAHLERGRRILQTRLPNQPLLDAILWQRTAEAHWDLGQQRQAAEYAIKSLAGFVALYPEGHIRTATAHALLVKVSAWSGEREKATEHARAALALYRTLLGSKHWRVQLMNQYVGVLEVDQLSDVRSEVLIEMLQQVDRTYADGNAGL